MKRLLLMLLLTVATHAHAERWIRIGDNTYMDIDTVLQTVDGKEYPTYRIYLTDYDNMLINAVDCKIRAVRLVQILWKQKDGRWLAQQGLQWHDLAWDRRPVWKEDLNLLCNR